MTIAAPCKARCQPPQLSPAETKRQQWLAQSATRDREQRQAHRLRELLLDLAAGLLATGGALVLALSYLRIFPV